MDVREKLSTIEALVETIRLDLGYEYERTTSSTVYAQIGGVRQKFEGVDVEICLAAKDLVDDSIPNALVEIEDIVSDILDDLRRPTAEKSETLPTPDWRDSDTLLRVLAEQVKAERSGRISGSYAYSLWPAAFSDLLETLPGIATRFARPESEPESPSVTAQPEAFKPPKAPDPV